MDNGIIKFVRYGKLYSHAVPTVSDNCKGFTDRQFKDAKAARDLQAMLGFPTTKNFKHIIQLNQIRNCPVTLKDIANAEKIFGDDIASLKGQSTRRKPPIIKEDFIEIQPKIWNTTRKSH